MDRPPPTDHFITTVFAPGCLVPGHHPVPDYLRRALNDPLLKALASYRLHPALLAPPDPTRQHFAAEQAKLLASRPVLPGPLPIPTGEN